MAAWRRWRRGDDGAETMRAIGSAANGAFDVAVRPTTGAAVSGAWCDEFDSRRLSISASSCASESCVPTAAVAAGSGAAACAQSGGNANMRQCDVLKLF